MSAFSALPYAVVDAIADVVGESPAALHEPRFRGNEWNYLKECLDSTFVSSVGKFVDRFEARLAAYTGGRRAIAAVNGTTALHVVLRLAGVEPGDEVLVPALTFVANAVAYCHATPHFVDSKERALGIDARALRIHLLAEAEAQQRRAFFDQQLRQSRDRLARVQLDLESSGFNSGALKAEPKAAADAYTRLRAEATAAEVRLATMRGNLAEGAPEMLRQRTELEALRTQLSRTERATEPALGPDYIGKYREFKYQETLFDLYAREFEIARADESREGMLIQVVDPATPPEKRSSPKRTITATVTTAVVFLALVAIVVLRGSLRGARPTAPSMPVEVQRI